MKFRTRAWIASALLVAAVPLVAVAQRGSLVAHGRTLAAVAPPTASVRRVGVPEVQGPVPGLAPTAARLGPDGRYIEIGRAHV